MTTATIFPPERVTIVGILNVTPDSFSDGGRFVSPERVGTPDVDAALRAARALVREGADCVDVGGESTRPGAARVDAALEIARTRPVIEAIAKELDVPISIDTRKAAVAEAALAAGASIVNDVSGLRADPALAEVAARSGAGLILSHLRGEPATMQRQITFRDVVGEVGDELANAVAQARAAGVRAEQIAVDPGIGFGKTLEQNLALIAHVADLKARTGCPVLVGTSRKSFLGKLTGDPVEARDAATHASDAVAIFAGADAIRVHDVAGARRTAAVARAIRDARRASHAGRAEGPA